MKALEKDRNRRYETANGLAADVQRYLADEPVQACPPSAGYRLRKFVRRNKGPVLAAALVLLALVAGSSARPGRRCGRTVNGRSRPGARRRRQRPGGRDAGPQAGDGRPGKFDRRRGRTATRPAGCAERGRPGVPADDRGPVRGVRHPAGRGRGGRAMRALGHSKVGTLRQKLGERAEAWASYQKAGELYRQLAADFPAAFAHRADWPRAKAIWPVYSRPKGTISRQRPGTAMPSRFSNSSWPSSPPRRPSARVWP